MAIEFDKISVMVVDDNAHMRGLLSSILHALGVKRIQEAGDAKTALKQIPEFLPDILITDWHMEPTSGIDLVRKIRVMGEGNFRFLPIIMLTGHTEAARVRAARDAGVNEFLAKPISAKALLSRLVLIVDQPRRFIECDSYFGPDRRRQDLGPPKGVEERRKTEAAPVAGQPDIASADEVDTLLNS